jgi:hypothetical protein
MKKMKNIHVLLFFIFQLIVMMFSSTGCWMNVGVFVEYQFESPMVIFSNNTIITFNGSVAFYRWECVELDGYQAKVVVSLRIEEEKGEILFSNEAYINVNNRSVKLLNGTSIGTTCLWLDPFPIEGEDVILWDSYKGEILAKVDISTYFSNSPQGKQKVFGVTIRNEENEERYFHGFYDFDTGIKLDGTFQGEATCVVLGIQNLLFNGTVSLSKTNINLNSENNNNQVSSLYWLIAFLIVYVFVSVYRCIRMQSKRRKNNK